MHKRFVAHIVARITFVVSMIMTLPLLWALHDDIHSAEVKSFAIAILLGMALSAYVMARAPITRDMFNRINAKDGLSIVGLSWIALSLLGAMPLYWTGVVPSFTDAFFEIVSGFTTTGASILPDIEVLPRGILFWRSLTHWLGGMGIIVLYIALLPALGTSTGQLYKAEAPGITVERVEPRIKETAKNLWVVYFFLSFVLLLLLMAGRMPFFDALCHTFGTMATGGFSTKNLSIAAYGPYIQTVITVFMFLAGVNFVLHYQALHGRPLAYFKNEEFRFYVYLLAILIPVFILVLAQSGVSTHPILDANFQIISILTTTGYVTVDFDLWPNALRFTLVMLMFIGGCGGSTGGGMKFIRVFLTLKIALRSITQAAYPNAVIPIKINGRPLNDKVTMSVLSYFMIFIHLLFLGGILFSALEDVSLTTALTASIAALSNIGPGLGEVGPAHNYAWVSIPGKWLLTFLMLAGRLELYSVLVLLAPGTWRK